MCLDCDNDLFVLGQQGRCDEESTRARASPHAVTHFYILVMVHYLVIAYGPIHEIHSTLASAIHSLNQAEPQSAMQPPAPYQPPSRQ